MRKVLHVIGPTSLGGAQTQLLGLVDAAHGRHWHATVCSTAEGPLSHAFRSLPAPFVQLRRRGSPGLGRLLALRRLIASHEFDVVNAHLWHPNALARLAVAGRRARPTVVIVEHNVEPARSDFRRVLDRALANWTDGYVALTDAMAAFTQEMHGAPADRVFHVPNAVDRRIFHPSERPRNRRLVVGSIGRLDPEKGFHVLVEAVRLLSASGVDMEVRIAGVGAQARTLAEQAAGLPVQLVGAVAPGQAVASFLRSLDVFVLPSTHREARPVAVLEALCCGVPVVATDIPGMRETVSGGAELVPPGDVTALANAIRRTEAGWESMRHRAWNASKGIPTFDELARRYAAVFEAATASRRGNRPLGSSA